MRIVFFILCMICTLSSIAQQQKRNNNWVVGYQPAVKFDFNNGVVIDSFENNSGTILPLCGAQTASCISDTLGDLLFFSNGFIVYDREGFAMDNGVFVNCPQGNLLCNTIGAGAISDQSSIILPKKNNQYYIFSTGMSDSLTQYWIDSTVFPGYDVFNYSIVDMDSNAGMGKVTVKNQILLQNQHYATAALTAVRHANNKDWWLVKADCYNHQYQQWLVKEDTILGPYYHTIVDTGNFCYRYAQIYFSEDGTKFVSSVSQVTYPNSYYLEYCRADIYDFDRSTGSFTYRNYYRVPSDTVTYPWEDGITGVNFSPDSKLLYMSTAYSIYQIDIMDTNRINAIYIHGPDTTIDQFQWYHILANGVDGNMYIGNFNGSQKYMSYIDKPNVRGTGCDFVAHGIWQPYTNLMNPPNMPNYGLGQYGTYPLPVVSVVKEGGSVMVYPNPTSNQLNIEYTLKENETAQFILYDMLGNALERIKLYGNVQKATMDVSHLAQGMYTYKVTSSSYKSYAGKFIID